LRGRHVVYGINHRERAHNDGRGAKYTAGRGPVRVVYSESHQSRSAAQKREYQIKRWDRVKKEALVAGCPS
jgi:putative endonuclease